MVENEYLKKKEVEDTSLRRQEEVCGNSYSFLLAEEFAFLTHFLFMLSSLGLQYVLISQVCLHLSFQHLNTQIHTRDHIISLWLQCVDYDLQMKSCCEMFATILLSHVCHIHDNKP